MRGITVGKGQWGLALCLLVASVGCRLPAQAAPPAAAVAPLGEFSNMRHPPGHCSGYSVELWQAEGKLEGLFLACSGLEGDTRTGKLEDVEWSPETGTLSFTARLTLGSDIADDGSQVPSRDVFRFRGKVDTGEVTGSLRSEDRADPDAPKDAKNVTLKKLPRALPAYASQREWDSAIALILKVRGPKW